ncbi:site-specific integrase [Nocardia speluncae]|uniref:Site-specific integrase n=1 Tax=Nocardia speluncae TaxID=419477 RepID=A0A846XGU9_9NOCA|nr:site-specific integrase [Nocardia speluncae]NKY33930.1 site-specific integrase [Nocardia speluncae]
MGHVEDRWQRPKRDENDDLVLNGRGKPVMERTELYGRGMRYRVRYIDPAGAERSKSFPDRQRKRADDFLIEVESDKREGKYIDPRSSKKTFRQQAESWVRAQSADPATRETLRSRLESRIYPVFGDLPVGRIAASTIRDWVSALEERKYADNYKAVLFDIVAGVLETAVDDRLIRENPCRAKTVRRPIRRSPKVEIWPDERVALVRRGLSVVGDRYSVVVPIGVGLGLRQGELLGLSPDDIDREAMTVHVQRQVKYVKGTLMFALPKREKTRYAPLSRTLLDVIDSHAEQFPAQPVTLPWASATGELVTVRLLIVKADGMALSGDLFNKIVWKPAFGKADLAYRNRADGMHAMRHLYASKLLGRGVSVKELADYLGHDDPGFTLRVYTHLLPSSHERARQAVDDAAGMWELPADDGLQAA